MYAEFELPLAFWKPPWWSKFFVWVSENERPRFYRDVRASQGASAKLRQLRDLKCNPFYSTVLSNLNNSALLIYSRRYWPEAAIGLCANGFLQLSSKGLKSFPTWHRSLWCCLEVRTCVYINTTSSAAPSSTTMITWRKNAEAVLRKVKSHS